MDFWSLMVKKDDFILSFVENMRRSLFYIANPQICRIKQRIETMPKEGLKKDLYIILNGPSLQTQDLTPLQGKCTMFVNRGFMHPLYKMLQPKYHIFVDNKMLKGIWPVSWLDEIWSLSSNTKIILPIEWMNNPLFSTYKNKIYWLTRKLPFYNLGVSGSCFAFAIQHQFENIYFTGFDANGIGYEMIKPADSHFYGNDKELEGKSTKQFAIDLLMHSRHLHDLNRLAIYCQKRNIKIINLTNGGLLDMFPRKQFFSIIK